MAAGLGGGGLRRQPVRIDRDLQSEIEQPRGGGQSHHAGAEHRHFGFMRADQMRLDDIAHLGGTTPAQGDAAAAMAVIVDEELVRDRQTFQPVGAVAKRPHAGNAGARRVGIESEVGRRQIRRGWRRHQSTPHKMTGCAWREMVLDLKL